MTSDELLALCGGNGELARRVGEAIERIEREHRAEVDRLAKLIDELPAFLTVLEGPELRIARVNRRVRELLAPKIGQPIRESFTADNPVVAALERVYATGVPETLYELPTYHVDGNLHGRLFTRSYAPLRDERGNVRGVMALGHEVTEEAHARSALEEAERRGQAEIERLMALLEEAPVFIVVLEGPRLRVVMMNRCVRELFAGRDMRGVSYHDFVPPTHATLMAASRVYAGGKPETFEVVSEFEGFVGRSFSTTVVPIRDANGQITRVMTVSIETTEQRRGREAIEAQARDLDASRREAVEASRAKDDFLAMLSHELRNPLAPMVATLELMRERGAASPEVELLERQVRHVTRLVEDLLDVARIARGRVELKSHDVDLSNAVNRALEITGPLLEERRHRVISDLASATVRGDPDRLAQVVANLITNAANYSEIGSQIRIDLKRADGRAQLVVADDGIGIAPDMIGSLFEAFVQQPQTLARSRGGLGLGLSIVRSFVQAHGGTISAHSDGPGRGSTFVIELPTTESRARVEVAPPPKKPRPSAAVMRILVVDDNPDVAGALRDLLLFLGHNVVIAHDGPSALATAASFKPQVGMLDIGLPGMDGYQLASALRAAHDVRLAAITGYAQERDRQRARDAGFEAHLVKPVDLDQLVRLLRGFQGE